MPHPRRPTRRVRPSIALAAIGTAAVVASLAVFQALDWPRRHEAVATGPVTSAPDAEPPAVTAPPGVEVVPETETAPSATGPTRQSAGRAAGLHRTRDPLRLTASAAIALDADTGQVLASKNAEAVLPMASLTKIMTALLIADSKLPMNEQLTITDDDVDTERNSRSRLRVGTTLSRGEALHLALMSSENRAAHALGRTFPGGMSQFVNAMNNRARQLGMNNTTYVDPTGLSSRNQSTARDLATLVLAASKVPLLREFSTDEREQVSLGNRTLMYLNSNRLVRNGKWEIDFQKTGYIVEAGMCVTMKTRIDGREVVMVLLDAGSNPQRWADAERIRKWIVSQGEVRGDSLALAREGSRS